MAELQQNLALWGKPENIDPYGDLILRIGEHHQGNGVQQTGSIRVCSATLCRLSKFFQIMLFGPRKESKPDSEAGEWAVDLPDDRFQPLRLILAILHSRFDLVKGLQMQLHTFHQVLVTADKYDLLEFLAPWIQQCVQATMERTGETLIMEEKGQCLVAAQVGWMLGDAFIMCRELRVFVPCWRLDGEGNLFALRDDVEEAQRRGLNRSPYGCFPSDLSVGRVTLKETKPDGDSDDLLYIGPANLIGKHCTGTPRASLTW